MRLPTRRKTWWMAVVGILILAAAGSPTVMSAGANTALVIQGLTVSGNEVRVSILNLGADLQRAIVKIDVLLADRVMEALASVAVPGGQKVFLVFSLPEPVRQVTQCGVILDDGTPFGF